MARVLHLLAPRWAGDEGVIACAAAMSRGRSGQHALVLGDRRDELRAVMIGVGTLDRVHASDMPLDWFGRRRVCRGVRTWIDEQMRAGVRFECVQCWCGESARVAAMARLNVPITACLVRAPKKAMPRGVRVCVFDAALERHIGSVQDGDCVRVLTPPVVGAAMDTRRQRETLRASLGIGTDDVAVCLVPHDPAEADASAFAFVLGLVHVALGGQKRLVGVIPEDVVGTRAAVRFMRAHGHAWGFVRTDKALTERLSIADVAVCDDAGLGLRPGAMTVQLAERLGTPVVRLSLRDRAGLTRMAREVLESLQRRAERCSALRNNHDTAHTLDKLWNELLNVPTARDEAGMVPA